MDSSNINLNLNGYSQPVLRSKSAFFSYMVTERPKEEQITPRKLISPQIRRASLLDRLVSTPSTQATKNTDDTVES